jgi:hypothetical protein
MAATSVAAATSVVAATASRGRVLRTRILAADNYALVLLLIVLSILLMAATDVAPVGHITALILFGGILLFALHTSGVAPRLRKLASILVPAGVLLAIGSILVTWPPGAASGIEIGMAGVLVLITPFVIARRLIRHPAVSASTVAGALCIYLLVGLFFAFLCAFTTAVGLGPFFASPNRASDADYLYFSFSTLTTLGYGDLVARTNLGRMLAVTEALFGQMYLVTVVALLVSNFGRERRAAP